MAKRAVYISSLLIVAERMRDRADQEVERDEWSRFLQLGEYSRDTYLGVAHGEQNTLSDTPGAFAEFRKAADGWEARALSVSRRLWVEDEKWRAAWEGPSYRVTTAAPDVVAPSGASTDETVERVEDRVHLGFDSPDIPGPTASTRTDAHMFDAGVEPGPIPLPGVADGSSVWASRLERRVPLPSPDRPSVVCDAQELPTDQTYAMATCIFCESPAGQVEYVWPEWLCRPFTDRVAAGRIDGSTDSMLVSRMRSEVDQTIDCVCPTCVHGWMQDLDDDVLAFLPKMVEGNETHLSPRNQGLLARWAARTAAIMEYADENRHRIPRAACEHLRRVGVHAGTQVLLGRYDGHALLLSHQRDLFRHTVGAADYYAPQTTFVIGKVFMQVLTDPWRDNPPTPVEDTTPLLIPLVPVHRRKIDWPPTTSIDDSLYDLVRQGTI